MEVIVVTGTSQNKHAMGECCYNLAKDGFKELNYWAEHDAHPRDITKAVENEILCLYRLRPSGKFYIKTNSDHYINTLRVMRFEGKIDSLKIKHFGPDGNEYNIEVGLDGELSSYPDGLLDEWPNMMARLAPKDKAVAAFVGEVK